VLCRIPWQLKRHHNPLLHPDRPIRDAIPVILSHDCVLVRNVSRSVTGIVTAADICVQYERLTGPFLFLGEIETNLRRLIGRKVTREDLLAAKDPNDANRVIEDLADLSLGEAVRLLNNPAIWRKLELAIDRVQFGAKLESVRRARNSVMHFDPEGITDEVARELSEFARALRELLRALGG
jgi:hypothetical protein